MQKNNLIVLVSLLFLCSYSLAFADAVYLKNGKVMKGRIVEKNPQYIVLKSGEGQAAVRSTIFSEDILRIESEEAYSGEESLIASQLKESEFLKSVTSQEPFYRKLDIPTDSGAADIRRLIALNRKAQAKATPVEMIKQDKTTPEPLKPILAFSGAGSGVIAGTVRLPKAFQEKKGPLYVYLMQKIDGREFSSGRDMIYKKIEKENIFHREVRYAFDEVPSGTYKVFAQWDIEPPPVEEKEIQGHRVLWDLGTKGDYTGSSVEAELSEGGRRDDVNIDCGFLVTKDAAPVQPELKYTFQVQDIYQRRLSALESHFLVLIKNTSDLPIPSLSFDVFINEDKVTETPLEIRSFEPQEEKEYDITSLYQNYRRIVVDREGSVTFVPKELKFRFVWTADKQTKIEKTIRVI